MNIIVCGAGRVGSTIAKQLSALSHSITIIDQSSEDIQKISDSMDVKGIVGMAPFPSVLEKAGGKEAYKAWRGVLPPSGRAWAPPTPKACVKRSKSPRHWPTIPISSSWMNR